MRNPFKNLTKFETALWITSVLAVIASFVIPAQKDIVSFIGSFVGVTALILCAKGDVIGQVLIVIFAVLYSVVSYSKQYYGEMITYLCMSAPMALAAVVSWIRHPYKGNRAEVEIKRLNKKEISFAFLLSAIVSIIFYFILGALDTAQLGLSTLSVTTSFLAAYFTFRRSPYYALGYAANDVVLIGLWIAAAIKDPSKIGTLICFIMFLVNDMYGFVNWRRMAKNQANG